MDDTSREFLDLLRSYQARNRLTDEEMAARLGIAPSSWSLFRRGLRRLPHPRIFAGFARLYPRRMSVLRDVLTSNRSGRSGEGAA